MKFNVVKIGNRDYVDIGDLTTCLYNLSLTKNDMDRGTLATVISAQAFIASKFAEKRPKEQSVYVIGIADGIFFKEIARVFKENKKRLPKKQDEAFLTVDEETYSEVNQFNALQLSQFTQLLDLQTDDLKKVFEEAVSKIKINITPAPTGTGTGKKKASTE